MRSRYQVGMRVLISGSNGFVGEAVVRTLRSRGHEVTRLERRPRDDGEPFVSWDPDAGHIDDTGIEGHDGVVHLAGESIASGRWNELRKERILSSRTKGTGLLARTLPSLAKRPRVLVSASAVGFYGDRGDEVIGEDARSGRGFLAEVCAAWEAAAQPARDAGVRVVHPRIGMVLAPHGGALAKMLPIYRKGAGGRIGDGRQWVSWIALDDLALAILHILETETLDGPVNAIAPNPVTSAELTKALGEALSRPTPFPAPRFAIRLAMGEMGEELLLSGQRCSAHKLVGSGFGFMHPEIGPYLKAALG